MTEKILVPVLGESITEATISKWLKNKGDSINVDEAIVELEKLSKVDVSDTEFKLNFKTANFENRIYSVTKC